MAAPQIGALDPSSRRVAQQAKAGRFGGMNLPFLAVIVILVCFGLAVLYSATANNDEYNFLKQLGTVVVGSVIMLVLWRFDYRRLSGFMTLFLVCNVLLILSPHLPFIGVEAKGARSWINIGMQLQPGEFAKITVILLDASVMARYGGRLDDPMEYVKALGLMLVPFVCIMTQPDLGTGLVYLSIAAVALIAGGARPKHLLVTLGVGILCILLILGLDELLKTPSTDKNYEYEYKLLKNYQRDRLLVFLNPEGDTSDSGYNLQQAQIAIGSGGLLGKGWMQGTQAALNYLPEAPTDFIFCVLAEEFGFMGVMVLLGLYIALLGMCFSIARGAPDLFGMLMVVCVAGMWLFQILENIGMDLGLMPITGIPLPFMSYGNSFMLVNFVMLGLVGSVWSHSNGQGRM